MVEIDFYDLCIDKDIFDAQCELEKVVDKVLSVDEKIDDGLDNGAYLMLRSYAVLLDGKEYRVRLYYPNDDYVVSYVDTF